MEESEGGGRKHFGDIQPTFENVDIPLHQVPATLSFPLSCARSHYDQVRALADGVVWKEKVAYVFYRWFHSLRFVDDRLEMRMMLLLTEPHRRRNDCAAADDEHCRNNDNGNND